MSDRWRDTYDTWKLASPYDDWEEPPEDEELPEGTNQLKQENMRLRLEKSFLLAALQRAESDLDVALERVRAAIAKVTDEITRDR